MKCIVIKSGMVSSVCTYILIFFYHEMRSQISFIFIIDYLFDTELVSRNF